MRVILYTMDMLPGTERLMPWRTLLEVAREINLTYSGKAIIVSGQEQIETRTYDNIKIIGIRKGSPALARLIEGEKFDVLCYPIAFRDICKFLKPLHHLVIKKIAYVPGGIYSWSGVCSMWRQCGFRRVIPYLLEMMVPHSLVLERISRFGFDRVVTFSDTTARNVACNSKLDVITALPGKDPMGGMREGESVLSKYGLAKRKYLLFAGAPAPIRGSRVLLRAFDEFCLYDNDFRLVMLMRQDNGSDFSPFEDELSRTRYKERVIVIRDRLSRDQLQKFFSDAYAAVLPFLLIPSEIPLTFFELLSCGTPVVTFENGGTTDYLKSALIIVPKRTGRSLARSLLSICEDSKMRDRLSDEAQSLMKSHPTWAESSSQWIKLFV